METMLLFLGVLISVGAALFAWRTRSWRGRRQASHGWVSEQWLHEYRAATHS